VKDCKDNLMTPDVGWAGAKNALLLRRFNTQTIILPRQARDKHRENSKQGAVFSQLLRLAAPSAWKWPAAQTALMEASPQMGGRWRRLPGWEPG
jgi:hypothetical protein